MLNLQLLVYLLLLNRHSIDSILENNDNKPVIKSCSSPL